MMAFNWMHKPGDSRYLSRDLLAATALNQPHAEVLMKADIFALACSIYELVSFFFSFFFAHPSLRH